MNLTTIKTTISTLITASILFGCSGNMTQQPKSDKIGVVVTMNKKDIYYKCGNKEKLLNEDGGFECSSFPISFYRDSIKLGSISSLHHDGFVFPQDMQLLEDNIQTTAIRIASR